MANHRKARNRGSIYFSRGQLFGVASLFVVAAAVIFFFGILIGQSIEERKLVSKGDAGVTLPVQPGASGDDLELTFPETLTKPEPPEAGAPVQRPPAGDDQTPWTVQVAAAKTRALADNMAAELKKRGYEAYVTSGRLNQTTFYRVRVGRYGSRQEAMTDLQRLKKDKYDVMLTRTQ